VRILSDSGIIDGTDLELLQRAVTTRNSAVHSLKEPTAEEVRLLLTVVREFVAKYLGDEKAG